MGFFLCTRHDMRFWIRVEKQKWSKKNTRGDEEEAKRLKNAPLPIYAGIERSLSFPAYRWSILCYLIAWKSCRKANERTLFFVRFFEKLRACYKLWSGTLLL